MFNLSKYLYCLYTLLFIQYTNNIHTSHQQKKTNYKVLLTILITS